MKNVKTQIHKANKFILPVKNVIVIGMQLEDGGE